MQGVLGLLGSVRSDVILMPAGVQFVTTIAIYEAPVAAAERMKLPDLHIRSCASP